MILIDAATGKQEARVANVQALSPEAPRCAFCGRGRSDVARLFGGLSPDATICDRCVRLGAALIAALIAGARSTP